MYFHKQYLSVWGVVCGMYPSILPQQLDQCPAPLIVWALPDEQAMLLQWLLLQVYAKQSCGSHFA